MGYSNVSRPMGFSPLIHSGKNNGIVRTRPVPSQRQAASGGNASTDMAVGDAYGLDANGNAFRAGPNDSVRGIVVGLRFLGDPNVMGGQGPISLDYITGAEGAAAANTIVAQILGCEDPTVLFQVQADSFAANNIGGLFNLADAAPDPTYAQSRQTLAVLAGVGAQFQAEDIVNSPADNAYGTNPRVQVRLLQTFNG